MSTIAQILRENVAKWAKREALIVSRRGEDRMISFAELEASADRFAKHLVDRDVRKGDPVLVFVPMSIELYITLLGIFRIGAIAVFLDPSSGLAHINACCKKLPPKALVAIWPIRLMRPFVRGLRRIPQVYGPPAALASSGNPATLPAYPGEDDPALITFTSGSTGQPKAAVRSHRFLIAQHKALEDSIRLEEGERDLTTLPIFVLANLASGVTSILPDAKISRPGAVDATRVARQIERLKPTRTGGSPAFYRRLLEVPGSLSGFRKIYTGGAPVFPSLLQKLQQAAPSAEVVAVYGSTEAEPIAHVACQEIDAQDWKAMRDGKGLLAGVPIPEIRLRILPDQWGGPIVDFEEVPAGQIGEILVTGDHVLKTYLHGRGDEETKVLIENETWHRTGDAGYLNARGRLWLVGRCSARIADEHGTLYPFTVECVAMTFPEVRRAAFVEHQGKRLLVVEPETSLGKETLRIMESAIAWANISEVRLVKRMPVDSRHNAKINYPKLRKLL